MDKVKDNFSIQANEYQKYRPVYPKALIEKIVALCKQTNFAWDCATGNGQVALELSPYFEKVYATDISRAQLEKATPMPNIEYSLQGAEKTDFNADFFDLIVVGQALHWFDFIGFNQEVRRVAKNGALYAAFGYGLLAISPQIDEHVCFFYNNTIGKYWDPERRYIDRKYEGIPMPFDKELLFSEEYSIELNWTLKHFMGYLSSWSSVQHYIKQNNQSPLDSIYSELSPLWSDNEPKKVSFPLFLKVGYVEK